jgi:hypothetical protein
MWVRSSFCRRDRKESNVFLSKKKIIKAIAGEVPDLSSDELEIPTKEQFARTMDRRCQRIANEYCHQHVVNLGQHNLFATMSTTTNCSTALQTGDGRFQRLRARLLRSSQQEGQTLIFAEKAFPRAPLCA